jgi:hypothetical protein
MRHLLPFPIRGIFHVSVTGWGSIMRVWQPVSLVIGLLIVLDPGMAAEQPLRTIWAKAAAPIDGWCLHKDHAPRLFRSPDRQWVIAFECRGTSGDRTPHIQIGRDGGKWQELPLRENGTPELSFKGPDELMWSPNSRSFFVNGNENGYTNYMLLYHLDADGWHSRNLATQVQRDMVVSFPPCKASHHDKQFCREWERSPEHNIAALAWTRGGSGLIVMAEVPPTGSWGGILGQVQGYELSVPDGRILTRFTATELKAKWQGSMNWMMKIPAPPEYEPASHQK